MENDDIPCIVSQAHAERAIMAAAKARLAVLENRLLELASGKYVGTHPGDKVYVLRPAPALKPTPEAIELLREQVEPEQFKKR